MTTLQPFVKLLSWAESSHLPPSINTLRHTALKALREGLLAVVPTKLLPQVVKCTGDRLIIGKDVISLQSIPEILILGAGKATGQMCQALLSILNARVPISGAITIPHGQALGDRFSNILLQSHIDIHYGAHPISDLEGLHGVEHIVSLIQQSSTNALVLVLISGGGSALLPYPTEDISLLDLQGTTRVLLACGASIHEINCIRKHLSRIKGGRLATLTVPRRTYCLILSDVIGDDLSVIASGPTFPDSTTFTDALRICEKYGILDQLPVAVRTHLVQGAAGMHPETPKPGDLCFSNVHNLIIGSVVSAQNRISSWCSELGFTPHLYPVALSGEARIFGIKFFEYLRQLTFPSTEKHPFIIIGTGELTVTLRGHGVGGRNQEMLLSFLQYLADHPGSWLDQTPFVLIAAAFDGIEGNSPAMGGIIDSISVHRAHQLHLNFQTYLDHNNSFEFFSCLNDALVIGQTGTNVNDIILFIANPLSSLPTFSHS